MALKSLLNIISIHAPAKGATWSGCRRQLGIQFQSTLPRRERLTNSIHRVCYTQISIHAPAKGATDADRPVRLVVDISIHAPAKGATSFWVSISRLYQFQSTLPRRERRLFCGKGLHHGHFNPRSREGSDYGQSQHTHLQTVFQSTLPRRERQHLLTSFRLQYGYSLFHLTNKI